ncbi:MAG TPA: cyclic nucleotide-binding domain-containing protein [Sandaracinaceae bacterium LLY-WYZ-13_1]|nr:cyclic nucleotide-binding domain-containing protein [Sandaracinaceae bacterium LLY-WYZ-13_1]
MQIVAHGTTDVGRARQLNEDHFLVDAELGLYLVCDGMGGHASGDVASRMAADTVRAYLHQRRDLLTAVARAEQSPDEAAALLRHGIQSASTRIHALGQQDSRQKGMGTTCTALLVLGGKGVMGHVGDSRLYMARGGQVYQLSEDHTFVQEAIRRGMLTPEQAENNPHQNLVTRAVGPSPSVLVDTLVFDVLPGDTLLLCSDGLHGYVKGPSELASALRPDALEGIAPQLVHTANERGGADNITALTVRATSPVPESKAQHERISRVTAELEALSHIVLFSELDMKELVKVANAFDHRDHRADEVVVHEGDVAETLFVIVSGTASVTRNGTDIAILRAGDHFGEMALLSRRPRSATVRTLDPCSMLALERDRFYELMGADPVIAAKFLWRLAQTLSLRLDDVYLLQEQLGGADSEGERNTQTYGLFPSPFDGR